MGERSVTIGRDALGNAIVTGSNNLTFVFFGMEQVPADLVEALQSGRLRPAAAPGAVPLPALTLAIAFADDARTQWQITARRATGDPVMRRGPTPWQADAAFEPLLDAFARLACTPAETAEDAARLQAAAHRLGDALAGVLSADEAVFLVAAARGDPPPPLLVIESDDDRVLALPWELIRLDDRFAVRDGRLDVARSVPVSAAPVLSPPAAELSLLVNVSAPERSGLDYERESYLIVRALHEHLGVVVNEMGEVDDLVDGLRGEPTPLGVHFSGSRRARHAAVRGRLRRGSHGRGGRADHGDPPARPRAPAPFLLSPAAAAAAPVDVDGGHRPAATGDQTSGWSQNLV